GVGAGGGRGPAGAAGLTGRGRAGGPQELGVSPPGAGAEEVREATPATTTPLAEADPAAAATGPAASGPSPSPGDTVPAGLAAEAGPEEADSAAGSPLRRPPMPGPRPLVDTELGRSEEHTSELQSRE